MHSCVFDVLACGSVLFTSQAGAQEEMIIESDDVRETPSMSELSRNRMKYMELQGKLIDSNRASNGIE